MRLVLGRPIIATIIRGTMFLVFTFYHWNSENTISENPSEVITSAQVGQIESNAPISTPVTIQDPLHPGIESIFSSHVNKLWLKKQVLTSASSTYMCPAESLFNNLPFQQETSYYSFYNYKSIRVRATITAPKALTGFISFGWFPQTQTHVPIDGLLPWTSSMNNRLSSGLLGRLLLLRPDTKLLSISEPVDVEFNIPWTYPFSMLRLEYLYNFGASTNTSAAAPITGEPVFVCQIHSIHTHTTTAVALPVTWAVQYQGFRCFGRQDFDDTKDMELQMMHAAAGIAVGVAEKRVKDYAEGAIGDMLNRGSDYVSDLLDGAQDTICSTTGFACDDDAETNYVGRDQPTHDGVTFDTPTTVQPSIIGDTLSSLPSTSVSLRAPYGGFHRVPCARESSTTNVSSFLRRPQLIGIGTYTSAPSVDAVICRPPFLDINSRPNWFAYFGQVARWWRGSLRYHFVFAGHPFITSRFSIAYSPNLTAPMTGYAFTDVPYFENQDSQFSGSRTYSILIPYTNPMEYLPLNKSPEENPIADTKSIGRLMWKLQIINSAFDVQSPLSYMIFVSAGPDFSFYDPTPPGYFNVFYSVPPDSLEPLSEDTSLQMILPGTPDVITLMKGFKTADPGLFKPLRSLKQLGSYWSREMWPMNNATRYVNVNAYTDDGLAAELYQSTWPANNLFCSVDYLAYAHAMFLYWRGSMGFKTVFNTAYTDGDHVGYAYVTLGDPAQTFNTHTNILPYPGNPLGDSRANWGAGTIVTKVSEQPTMEFTIPMRHNLGVSFVHFVDGEVIHPYYYAYDTPPPVYTNIESVVQDPDDDTLMEVDLVYRKAGYDFEVFVESLMPYPSYWATRGFEQI